MEHKVNAAKCKACGKLSYPTHFYCPACAATEFEAVPLGGEGTLVTWTRAYALALELTLLGFAAKRPGTASAWKWLYAAGVAAAVVGVIAATCLQLGWAVAARALSLLALAAIALPALAAAWLARGRWAAPLIVAAGGAAGYLLL